MALITMRPGVWSFVYNSVALGLTNGDGFKLKFKRKSKKVNNTNLYGDALIDGIFMGLGDVQLVTTLKEWNAGVQHLINPNGTAGPPPVFDGIQGIVGTLDSAKAQQLVGTCLTGTPDATISKGGVANANTFTCLAILAPENDIEFLMAPQETDIPVLLDLLLYDDSGTKRYWKWTNV